MNYNNNNLSFYPVITEIENFLDLPPISDSEVWVIARESIEEPNFEDILLTESLDAIISELKTTYPKLEFDFYVNSSNTHFYCNHQEVKSLKDLLEILREYFWIELNFNQAWHLFNNTNFEVCILHDDGSETMIESTTDFITTSDVYGVPRCNK